jgi:hypothetical protein
VRLSSPGSALFRVASVFGMLGLSLFVVDCIDARSDVVRRDAGTEPYDGGPLGVEVTVDLSAVRATVAPSHYGMHSSVYDNALQRSGLSELMNESGIRLLRYPGGGYTDNYHWSIHALTPFLDNPDEENDPDLDPESGYLADRTDFGNFVSVVEAFGGRIMITVNYGTNLAGDGPGEPKEAAAWVAYANGDPGDERVIGVDGSGNDWQTVGYWASLRASSSEAADDGRNFLRIAHPEPLGIEYWEIGNEVFGNGFHENNGSLGFEFDLHVPYANYPDPTVEDDPSDLKFARYANEALSGTTYGQGVLAYIEEMKVVDPSIKVGAVLGTPPADYSWMGNVKDQESGKPRYWNDDVLRACGKQIDFGIVHWYPSPPSVQTNDPNVNTLYQLAGLLTYPRVVMPTMVSMLRDSIAEFGGSNAENVELVMTEVGTGVRVPRGRNGGLDRGQAMGIFAADMYLTAAELGFVNVDWLELHNGTFLDEAMQAKGPAFSGIQMAHLLAGPGDRLVTTTSSEPSLVVHASVREDGRIGVLLINTQAPDLEALNPTVTLSGRNVGKSGERYDYAPPRGETTDGGATMTDGGDAGVTANRAGASGTVTGPTAFSDMGSPFSIEVPPYGVTLLLFDPE